MNSRTDDTLASAAVSLTLFVLQELPTMLRETRVDAGIPVRAAAHEIGIGKSTLARLEAGQDHHTDLDTIRKALRFIHAHSRR